MTFTEALLAAHALNTPWRVRCLVECEGYTMQYTLERFPWTHEWHLSWIDVALADVGWGYASHQCKKLREMQRFITAHLHIPQDQNWFPFVYEIDADVSPVLRLSAPQK